MPFENRGGAPRRIAVIGGGISGLGAARYLAEDERVVVFEAAPRMGGHARTVWAGKRGDQWVDTGFIVFNHVNYPELTRLFDELGVSIAKSSMSFGVSIEGGRLEYALNSLDTLFAQRRNAVDPRFLGLIRDILRFNRNALGLAGDDGDLTIGGLIDRLGAGRWFRDYYLLPFSGAIWSTPTQRILDFPAAAMLRFFKNHALLGVTGQHQWYTVDGGSAQYVTRLEAALERRGVELRTGTPVEAVRRTPLGAEVRAAGGEWEAFDAVIFATHSDQALSILSDASGVERTALAAIRYQPNRAVLHADESMMPRRRKCWASWVYTEPSNRTSDRIGVSYWMNSLQPIPMDDPMFVTLNATRPIREDLIYDEVTFAHPVYDRAALAAQDTIRAINGTYNTWFCGAWMKNGFHEDGLASALDVARAISAERGKAVAAE